MSAIMLATMNNFDINKFNVGIGYALDFNEIAEKTKCGIFSARLGFNF